MIDFKKAGAYLKVLLGSGAFLEGHFSALGRYKIRRVMRQDAGKAVFGGKERVYDRSFIGRALRRDDLERISCGHRFLVRSMGYLVHGENKTSCTVAHCTLYLLFRHLL